MAGLGTVFVLPNARQDPILPLRGCVQVLMGEASWYLRGVVEKVEGTRHRSGSSLVWLRMRWWLCEGNFVLSHRRLTTTPASEGWKNLVVAGFYILGHQMHPHQSWGRGVKKNQSLKTGLCFPYSQFPRGECVSDTFRWLPPFSFRRLNECVCAHLGLFSHAVTSVSYGPVTSNRPVGPVLKPWPDSPSGTSPGPTCENCGEVFRLSFKPRKAEQVTHISLHPWKLQMELFPSRKDFGRI